MTGRNPLLPEYRVMQDNLMARQAIMHCKLPKKFLAPQKAKRLKGTNNEDTKEEKGHHGRQ